MAETLPYLMISVVLQGALTLIAGYALYKIRMFNQNWQDAEKQRARHDNILLGELDSDVTQGLVEVVELHDDELDAAKEEREKIRDKLDTAASQREKLRKRLEYLVEHAEIRSGNDPSSSD